MNPLSSKAIDWVRFPLVMLVLIMHCHPEDYAYCIPVLDFPGHSFGEMLYGFVVYAITWFGFATVPVFFLISGYLFFIGSGEQWSWDYYREKLKRRIRTLLIPFILFNLIAVISAFICGAPSWRNQDMIPILGYFWNSTTFCVNMHNWYGLDMQLYYPEIIALWYVRDLIFMCIISPVVWYFIKKYPKATLSILTLIYLSGLWIGANGYNSQAIMFFSLGASFSIHGKDLVQWSYRHLWKFLPATLMLWLIVTIWNSFTDAQQFNHALYYTGSFAVLGLAALWTEKSGKTVIPLFPNSSFFIFALHMCPIGSFCALAFFPQSLINIIGTPDNFWNATITFILGPWLVAAFCMAIYVVLKKICPTLLSLFTGGR